MEVVEHGAPSGPRNAILHGDALKVLQSLPGGHVQTWITSPPYFGLRDYQLPPTEWPAVEYRPMAGLPVVSIPAMSCCLGLESTAEAYIAHLVLIFREAWRALRDDGLLFLNLGDSFFGDSPVRKSAAEAFSKEWDGEQTRSRGGNRRSAAAVHGIRPKSLLGIPWRAAFALQAEGWVLRSEVIWQKSNGMPESVDDRPSKAHEQFFIFAKSAASSFWTHRDGRGARVKPKGEYTWRHRETGEEAERPPDGHGKEWRRRSLWDGHDYFYDAEPIREATGRNARTVWSVATIPYRVAHFATMPPKLAERAVLAGSSPRACEHCGAPWARMVVKERAPDTTVGKTAMRGAGHMRTSPDGPAMREGRQWMQVVASTTIGWQPTCACEGSGSGRCIVGDMFAGSGTTAAVAKAHGRDWLGIDLKAEYIPLAQDRLAAVEAEMARAAGQPKRLKSMKGAAPEPRKVEAEQLALFAS